jgi:short-subunit dehydrogenase
MKNPTFRDNVTIITGASLGIGRELALQLAGQGACLALAARSAEKLAELSAQCNDRGGRAIPVPTDVADQRQCQALIERTVQEYGRIDTLINNAGVGMAARFDQLEDLELFEKVFRINFFGGVYCTFYALPYLVKTRGRLVAVASGRGLFPSASADAYGPSKHAMVGFFNSLRNELAPGGVSVTLIFPEWVSTGITARSLRMDGVPTGELSPHEINAMSAETCARVIIETVEKRKRQVIMTFLPKLGLWLRLIAPAFIDRVVSSKTD